MPEKNDIAAELAALEGVAEAPVENAKPKRKKASKLEDKIANEPVRFSAVTGRIYATDGVVDRYGVVLEEPLIVDFGAGHGEEAELTGGLSREFYPDRDDENEGSYRSGKQALAQVREYIATDKHGICAQWLVREADTNPPKKPFPAFDDVHPNDLADLYKKGILDDIVNAARWETRHKNRPAVLAALDEIQAAPEEPEDADILAAEVVV